MAIRLLSSESINGALTIGGALTGTSATFAGTISAIGASTFTLNDSVFIKAVNGTNNVAATNVWGYGLYEGASKLGEISLVRDGSSNQMYIGTTNANQTLRIGTANKVTALTINASQNATFAGSVNVGTKLGLPDGGDVFWDGGYGSNKPVLAANGTTMKMYPSGASGGLQFSISPTTAAFTGNVGIGDSSPSFPLVISKSSSTSSMGADLSMRLGLTNPDQTNNNLALITFGDGTSEPGSGFFGMQFTDHTNNYGELVFGTRGVVGYGEKMRIDSEGNVGIQNTSPGALLDVGATIHANTTGIDVTGVNCIGLNTADNHNWFPYTDGNNYYSAAKHQFRGGVDNTPNYMILDSTGLGIGTTTPDNKLQVVAGNGAVQAWFGETNYTRSAIRIGGDNAGGGRIYIEYHGDSSYIDCFGGHGSTQRYRDLAIAAQDTSLIGNVIGFGKNYATSQGWLPGAAGSFSVQKGYYGGDFSINGASAENSLIWGLSAFGNRALQWQTIGESQSDADGGWNKPINNLPDGNTHGYMSYVYVKRTSSATTGTFYYGCATVLQLNGTVNTNPYFHVHGIGSLPQDVWCVAIGVIQAYTDNNVSTPSIVGVYRVDTGAKILGGTSYRSQSGVQTTQSHRAYHYYSTNPAATLAFADPGFYVIDGTEPTLNDLLDGSAGGGSSPWTTTGNDIYNNNSGSVGINNTNPTAHYNPFNQLVVGDGTTNQGITIFAGSNNESSINFTDTTSNYDNNFVIRVAHNDSSENNNPSFQINFENQRFVTINKQTTGGNQTPQVRLGYFNNSSLPANLDHSMLEIGMPNGANNPGMVMYGDTQGNSNPFLGMVSTSGSSQITTKYLRFYHNTTLCGTIQKRYNANEVQYLTTSDYRLKEDLKPFKALDTICKINVYNYKWNDIEEDNVNYGVLAHELQELIPEVVAGEKDEVNKKGEEEYQSVDYSKLVPHLIQSIQELKAEIEILKSK